ncbi:MAG: rod shape-determining protein MreC [Candidatus Kerfeldbacteria bacterium CG_4_10_14_0_8_um_filter_42_10]|uniref:Cell shape-determining protein MreC n=1 Tax=Candidatus Kerfeldbacteria bacterium CG_4_10_14_0_8_um_filter_42_10 TaxID=2014248 RepID=A0A2M7RG13_9BACT|nr:MAG: rod shape-determining protein MreC [Candidatus Kerfeldbacteria bacterium CG_4_10_14_0_8_um_filter_42_10]
MRQKIFNFRINAYLSIAVALVLLIFLHWVGVLKPIEDILIYAIKPVEKLTYRLGLDIFVNQNTLTKEQLDTENAELNDKLSDALIENARLRSLVTKSETLQKELDFLNQKSYNAISTQIIGKPSDTTAQIYLLDKGEKDGVKVGLPVIYLDGILVGKIVGVENSVAQLLLINDSQSAVGAQIQNEASSPGIIVGKLGLALEMQFIPQTETVAKGQIVVTSGLEENIPPGLVIGQIDEVSNKTEELFQTATIESPVPLERLDVLSIIIP